jgi:hypothetical protein
MNENDLSKALFDAYDIKKTIESNSLGSIKRVHSGTENDDNLSDLITDVIRFLENLHNNNN